MIRAHPRSRMLCELATEVKLFPRFNLVSLDKTQRCENLICSGRYVHGYRSKNMAKSQNQFPHNFLGPPACVGCDDHAVITKLPVRGLWRLLVVTYTTTSFRVGSESVWKAPRSNSFILKLVKKMICALFRNAIRSFHVSTGWGCPFISQR
jgi:hypothetical protein